MKSLFIFLIVFCSINKVSGQNWFTGSTETEVPILYWNQPSIINPAETGLQATYQVSSTLSLHNTGYNNFSGFNVLADIFVKSLKSGIGVKYERWAPCYEGSSKTLRLNLSVVIFENELNRLSIGVAGGKGIHIPEYMVSESVVSYNAGFGIKYQHKKFSVGASYWYMEKFDRHVSRNIYFGYIVRNFNIYGKLNIELGEKWKLVPMALVNSNFIDYESYDNYENYFIRINTLFSYMDIPWIGIGIENNNLDQYNIQFMGGIDVWKLRLGYGFTASKITIEEVRDPTHELLINFMVN